LKVLAVNKIIQAQKDYSKYDEFLLGWYQVVSKTNFNSIDDLKQTFGQTVFCQSNYIMPIPHSKLVAKVFINFSAHVLLINEIISA